MDSKALYKFSYGVYIVSSFDGDNTGACVVNTGAQLTSSPYQVMVCVNKDNFTAGVIQKAGHFTLSVLSEAATMELVGTFGFKSSADVDKFADVEKLTSATGDPYTTQGSCAVLACNVKNTLDVGSHILFVGEVVDAEVLEGEPPMTYSYYHTVLRGKTPPKASAFVAEEAPAAPAPAPTGATLHHFRCLVCGYVHETELDELPDDFTCPMCGVGKDNFEKID